MKKHALLILWLTFFLANPGCRENSSPPYNSGSNTEECNNLSESDAALLGTPCDSEDSDLCANGTWTCTQDGLSLECINESEEGIIELCDGIDNDCDPSTEDGSADSQIGQMCDGPDSDSCKEGTFSCTGGQLVCSDNTADSLSCPQPTEADNTLCSNGIDDDNDGLTDCADYSCHGHPDVTVCHETDCSDNTDNDLDGRTDCEDRDCLESAACDSSFETADECNDTVDNDLDGDADCLDADCRATYAGCSESLCSDGLDNDSDGFTDCADYDCLTSGQCPNTEVSNETCSDGIDNDSNGFTDCLDLMCQQNPAVTVCEGNSFTCSDGIDEDLDGYTDCEDFNCRSCASTGYAATTCEPCP